METGRIVEIVVAIAGIVIVISSFWFLSVKKMTANFVVIWEIIGVALVMLGGTFRLSGWGTMMYEDGEYLAICISVAGLLICYQFSLVVSSLLMKNHEMAMEVSMLLQEKNETFKIPEKDLLIILPVKNEEKNIRKLLEQLSCPEIGKIADVLCVNDGSKDRSGQVIDEYPCMQIRNIFGLGYGSSLQLGYKYALRKGYQYVIQMDADGQHDVCNIPLIYQKLTANDGNDADIVLASRFMEGSSEFKVSVLKKFAFWLFRFMIYVSSGRKIADPTTGLQGLNREAFAYYSQYNNFDHQYPDANMVLQMLLLKFQVAEIPAVMHVRKDGKSMHSGLEPVWYMPRMFLNVLAVVFRIKGLKIF